MRALCVVALAGVVSGCAHGRASLADSGESEPALTWPHPARAMVQEPRRPPPGTWFENWPVIDPSGRNEIPPVPSREAASELLRSERRALPEAPASQIPLRSHGRARP